MGGFYCFQSCELYSVCKTSTLLANLHVHLICHMGVFCCFRFILNISHHWRVGGSAEGRPANDDEIQRISILFDFLLKIVNRRQAECGVERRLELG